ncbi:RNA polymerase sigma factor [Candidatus Formimonas warabiya]|uniref:RNA polymerase sigma factor 70 region 4 type 2 domain-containing protein n=1 Tax=Formimonas warabiya TaxID=1761012 RepID=A0A3G1KXR3_FORW1|nr:sigma factor-like helix-turn-helix DNA-binding protein [Candidatus Formimonas warabiya]ATW27313.1 hypothetical protein DCMF_23455 [Candidatus Formimonas warabiya]
MEGVREMCAKQSMIDCLNENSALLYNAAFRLVGQDSLAVELISKAVGGLMPVQDMAPKDLAREILKKMCRIYLQFYQEEPKGVKGNPRQVDTLLMMLPPKEKLALVLYDVLKLSRAEVIQILGEPEEAFQARLSRGRNMMKDSLKLVG